MDGQPASCRCTQSVHYAVELPAKGGTLERSSLRREKRAAPPHVHTVRIDDASLDHHALDDVR